MKHVLILTAVAGAMLISAGAQAHDVPNIDHSHVFQQTGYGTYRQGHAVNGPLGSIIIWSPQTQGGYQSPPPVRFARPQPITKAPGSPTAKTRADRDPALEYGKKTKKHYGG